ncbi:hypothetical protein HGRIS_014421 [Hohenbuehelia grisea]|uniref:Uncharacterized protein n=1 Tax=Hohenbuehelia grisea TaxID=104357 RepID=A0ABR3JUT4_9AGAR
MPPSGNYDKQKPGMIPSSAPYATNRRQEKSSLYFRSAKIRIGPAGNGGNGGKGGDGHSWLAAGRGGNGGNGGHGGIIGCYNRVSAIVDFGTAELEVDQAGNGGAGGEGGNGQGAGRGVNGQSHHGATPPGQMGYQGRNGNDSDTVFSNIGRTTAPGVERSASVGWDGARSDRHFQDGQSVNGGRGGEGGGGGAAGRVGAHNVVVPGSGGPEVDTLNLNMLNINHDPRSRNF